MKIHLSILAGGSNKLVHAGDSLDRWKPAVDSLGTKIKMKRGHLLESITLVQSISLRCLAAQPFIFLSREEHLRFHCEYKADVHPQWIPTKAPFTSPCRGLTTD